MALIQPCTIRPVVDKEFVIIQGKENDANREFRVAREQGKVIVSPQWLKAVRHFCFVVKLDSIIKFILKFLLSVSQGYIYNFFHLSLLKIIC